MLEIIFSGLSVKQCQASPFIGIVIVDDDYDDDVGILPRLWQK